MALQLSEAVRNARLDAIEASIGTGAVLKIRTGAPPANCAAARAYIEQAVRDYEAQQDEDDIELLLLAA